MPAIFVFQFFNLLRFTGAVTQFRFPMKCVLGFHQNYMALAACRQTGIQT